MQAASPSGRGSATLAPMEGRRILVADPDPAAGRRLGPALRARGLRLQVVPDGARALEAAILSPPAVVIYDEGCELLEPAAFVRLLRGNPRTRSVPVLVVGTGDEADLLRPCSPAALLARLDPILETGEVEGRLSQLSLVDLLQIFATHRNTGRLLLRFPGSSGEIVLVEGRIHDAVGGGLSGEKALFRWLTRTDGSFEFHPGAALAPDRIRTSVDALLLEAMRQGDELAELRARLPAVISLARDPAAAPGSVAEQIGKALARGPLPLQALLDACAASDLEVAEGIEELLAASVLAGAEPAAADALVAPDAVRRLRQRLLGRTGKITLESENARGEAGRIACFRPVAGEGFGTIGQLHLAEDVAIDLVLLPSGIAWEPLRATLQAGSLGTVRADVELVPALRSILG